MSLIGFLLTGFLISMAYPVPVIVEQNAAMPGYMDGPGQCENEVVCLNVRNLFNFLTKNDKRRVVLNNIAHFVDRNGDREVDFDEFYEKIVELITEGFNIIDTNSDGSIDELLSPTSLDQFRFDLFEKLLSIYTEMLDNDMDNVLTASDAKNSLCNSLGNQSHPNFDCNGEEKWKGKFSELFQYPNFFTNVPAPIKKVYSFLDEDQNQELTVQETHKFLKRILTNIDKNRNCQISLKEVLAVLEENNLAEDSLLAVKLMGEYFLAVAKYLVDGFIRSADTNKDSRVTLQEVLKFSDYNYMKSTSDVIHDLGFTPYGPAQYLIYRYDYQAMMEAKEKNLAMWLAVLDSFMNNLLVKSSSPSEQCEGSTMHYQLFNI